MNNDLIESMGLLHNSCDTFSIEAAWLGDVNEK